ncbi:DegV family protein [Halothermothrix orenii]|uniref:DegV family protein n=1 Tax=Halothermothrix orenii (strain H 168 / OCM 544 / DSM 9562) TaxID=373903 RepID=B8CWU8_HALOH|nr:DegV family protein [Halothermothrix orenii]ACL69767.1 degV family protein [Halothermothrix orenii H 168]
MKVGILTDSTCDLSEDILKQHNIEMIPLTIHFGEEIFKERYEITPAQFFERLENTEIISTTSQPSIGLFVDKYKKMAEEYDAIISIHLSSKFSGTVESARIASQQVDGIKIEVIDSKSISLGLGYQALLAAKLIEAGFSFKEIVDMVKKAREHVDIYFTVNDLSYLEKGGRIGKAQAFIGSILNVYPLLAIPGTDGEIIPLEKVRGSKRIIKKLVSRALDSLKNEKYAWIGLVHGADKDSFNKLNKNLTNQKYIKERADLYQIDTGWISSIIGCHAGPSVYGIVLIKGDILNYEGENAQ